MLLIRDVEYFYTSFEEFKVICPDKASDYFTKDYFDGVLIILL